MYKPIGCVTGLALCIATLPAAAQVPAPAAATPVSPGATPTSPAVAAPAAPAAAAPTAPAKLAPAAPPPLAEPPPVLAPEPEPRAAAPLAPAEEKAAPVGPDKLAVGKALQGFFQPSLLLQFWGFYSHNPNIESGDENASTFRVRRAEVRVKGDIIPGLLSYNVMFDPAKAFTFGSRNIPVAGQVPAPDTAGRVTVQQPTYSDPAVMQDYFITLQSDYADVSFGQFKIPVSYEGFNGASKLLFPERALVSRAYGDRRELGVKVEKKLGKYFFYSLGIFNGSGQNNLDNDNEKDVALRLEAYPVNGLTIGGVGYRTFGERDAGYRDRIEADIKYEGHDLFVLGEYIRATDHPQREVKGHGAYGALGYTFLKRLQPIARVGFINPDRDTPGDRVRHYEGGINYYLQGLEARGSLSVSAFELQDFKAASGEMTTQKTRWEAILAFQAGF